MPGMPTTKQMDDDAKCAITFNKLLEELFKEATGFSAFTGERVAIVVESENGEVYSFVTPSAETIVENFLSGNPSTDLGSEHNANIMQLQCNVMESEMAPYHGQEEVSFPNKSNCTNLGMLYSHMLLGIMIH